MSIRETEHNIESHVDHYLFSTVVELKHKLKELEGTTMDIDAVAEQCEEINSYIDFIAKGNDLLFEKFRLHLFQNQKGELTIAEGIEIVTDPPRKNDAPCP
jgi:hypothetical protein